MVFESANTSKNKKIAWTLSSQWCICFIVGAIQSCVLTWFWIDWHWLSGVTDNISLFNVGSLLKWQTNVTVITVCLSVNVKWTTCSMQFCAVNFWFLWEAVFLLHYPILWQHWEWQLLVIDSWVSALNLLCVRDF